MVDLVNDALSKKKYFNPQGWEPFGEVLREANVSQDLIGHEDRWRYITQTKRTQRSRTQFLTSFLLSLGVFGEYGLIGNGLCCRLRDLCVLLV
jgi:hypothetical protein